MYTRSSLSMNLGSGRRDERRSCEQYGRERHNQAKQREPMTVAIRLQKGRRPYAPSNQWLRGMVKDRLDDGSGSGPISSAKPVGPALRGDSRMRGSHWNMCPWMPLTRKIAPGSVR
jgi:hypothetical protein